MFFREGQAHDNGRWYKRTALPDTALNESWKKYFFRSYFILNKNKYICAYYYNYSLYENISFSPLQRFRLSGGNRNFCKTDAFPLLLYR